MQSNKKNEQDPIQVFSHTATPYTLRHLQPSCGVKLWLPTDTFGKKIASRAGTSPYAADERWGTPPDLFQAQTRIDKRYSARPVLQYSEIIDTADALPET